MEKQNLADIEKRLEVEPANTKLWLEKAQLLIAEEKFEEALKAMSCGLTYDPFDKELRAFRARKFMSIENYSASMCDFALAGRLNPEDWEIWYYMGVSAYMCGRYDVAKDCHLKSRELMYKYGVEAIPATVDWYWMICMKMGLVEEANKALELVYEGMPCEDGDYLCRTLLYKGVYQPEGFVEKCMADIKNADRPGIYEQMLSYGLANYLHFTGREEQSIALLKEIRACPDYHMLFAWKQAGMDLKERGAL